MVQIPIAMLLRCKYLLLSFYKKRKKRKEDAKIVMVMVHASAARYLRPDPFKLPFVFSATNLPTCPHHNRTMLFGHYLPGTFFFACVGFGPTFKESVFAPLANSGNSAELVYNNAYIIYIVIWSCSQVLFKEKMFLVYYINDKIWL